MIHIVGPHQRGLYADYLQSMHELRFRAFIQERGWELDNDGRTERDQFDHDKAWYALSIDVTEDAPRCDGCFRYIATEDRHMMAEVFPHLVPGGPPSGPDIAEWSRLAVDPSRRIPGRASAVFEDLSRALVELALLRGHRQVLMAGDEPVMIRCAAAWPGGLNRLGPATVSGKEVISAWSLPVSTEVLVAARKWHRREWPILLHLSNEADLAAWREREREALKERAADAVA